ncbi:unnamed protein product [Calypogeia fissa]
MQDILLNGNYDKFADEDEMHYPARLDEMFKSFSDEMHETMKEILLETKTKEILLKMTEKRGLTLPNFLPPTVMKELVSTEIDKVSFACTDLVPRTHTYAQNFVFHIIDKSTRAFSNLNAAYKHDVMTVLSTSRSTQYTQP